MSSEEKNTAMQQRVSDLEDEIVKLKEQMKEFLRAKDIRRVATLKDQKALRDACTDGDIELAKQISALDKIDLNSKDSDEKTPLHLACENGCSELVQHLCSIDAVDVRAKTKAGKSALHLACEVGCYEMVQYLCSLDEVDVQARTTLNETPLLLACSKNRADVVEFLGGLADVDVNFGIDAEEAGDRTRKLLELLQPGTKLEVQDGSKFYGAEVKSSDKEKETILISFDGYQSSYDEWLHVMSDRVRSLEHIAVGHAPIHVACSMGHDAIVESLYKIDKLDINAQTRDGNTALHLALINEHDGTAEILLKIPEVIATIPAQSGKIPLHIACQKKCEMAARNMLGRPEVDVVLQDKDGKTPFEYAAKSELFGIPKDQWEEIIAYYNASDKDIKSPLHIICQHGAHVAVEAFCKLFDANLRDENGKTPLHLACKNNHEETVRKILDVPGINLALQDEDGNTALHDACKHGHDKIAHVLLKAPGIDISLQDKDGETALSQKDEQGRNVLHLACARDHHSVVDALLGSGQIDVNSPDKEGNSPLAIACENGHDQVVKELLKSKHDDLNLQDQNGISVLAIACQKKHREVVTMLLEKLQFDAQLRDKEGHFLILETYEPSLLEVFEVLLQSKQFDLNVQNEEGMSLLHKVCSKGDSDTIKEITKIANVDCNIQDKNDETAFELLLRGRPEVKKTCDCLKMLVQNQTFEVVIQKRTGVVTVYDLLLDNYGYASTKCIGLLGVETFLFSQSVFVSYEDLLNIALFSGGEYGAVYKADIDIARKPNVNIVPRDKLKNEEAKGNAILIPVVCKISKSGASANEWYELQVLQNLPRHTNVVGLIAMCTGFKIDDGPVLYTAMVMNCKSGGSLLDQLKKRKNSAKGAYQFDLKYLCKTGLDIVSGVEHMHQHFYKHCDIAARNYLVGNRGKQYNDVVISITDFGLSRPFADQHDKSTRLPYRWCAPETLRTGYTSSLSDIWMVGVTLSEICCYPYRTPFFYFVPENDKNVTSSFRDFLVAGNRYFWATYRKRVPQQWLELCEWCCTISQNERPTLEQISDRLNSILTDVRQKEEEKRFRENTLDSHDVQFENINEAEAETKHDISDSAVTEYLGYTSVSGDISDSEASHTSNADKSPDDVKQDHPSIHDSHDSNPTAPGDQYHLLDGDRNNPVAAKGIGVHVYIPERRPSSKSGEDVYISRDNIISTNVDMDESKISLNNDTQMGELVAQNEKLVAQNEQLAAEIKKIIAEKEKQTERIAELESANPT